jgi:hypothetical protein
MNLPTRIALLVLVAHLVGGCSVFSAMECASKMTQAEMATCRAEKGI